MNAAIFFSAKEREDGADSMSTSDFDSMTSSDFDSMSSTDVDSKSSSDVVDDLLLLSEDADGVGNDDDLGVDDDNVGMDDDDSIRFEMTCWPPFSLPEYSSSVT